MIWVARFSCEAGMEIASSTQQPSESRIVLEK